MFVDENRKKLFIAVPRTGSTTMDSMLHGSTRKHPPPARYHKTLSEAVGENHSYLKFTKIAFVRNPWDRFVSLYYEFLGRGYELEPFVQFVKLFTSNEHDLNNDRHWWPQYKYVELDGWIGVDVLGRFEDFGRWCRMVAGKEPTFRHKNNDHPKYTELFDPETRDLVAEYYKQDVLAFDYEF